jgi:DNA-binding transcriptional ArsR family regulator
MEAATAPAPAEQAPGKAPAGISPEEARRQAMSHDIRRRALRHYVEHGPKSPVEVSNDLGLDLSKVSYHTRVLKKLGCLELVKEKPVRGSVKHYYVATERHLVSKAEFEALPESERKAVVGDAFQPSIDDVTRAVGAGTLGQDGDFHITRIPIRALDRQGYEELLARHMELFEETAEISRRAVERMAESGEKPIAVSSGQTCFVTPGF